MIAYSGEPEPAVDVMVEFRFLGTFAVRCGGSWHPGPPPKKGRELLQYLGTYPRRVATRDELAAAFWPGIDIDAVVHRLHLAASGARAYLRNLSGGSDALQCIGGGYAWSPGIVVTSDAERFIASTRSATPQALRSAVDLYGGDYLAGDYAEWLHPTRVRIAAARACALEAIARDHLERGSFATALAFGLDLVEAEPGHETGTRLVMRSYAALGQRTRALEQYNYLKKYLAREIGVEPTDETHRLAFELVGGPTAIA
jgi:DNA-binding SARP family transcriptional activator